MTLAFTDVPQCPVCAASEAHERFRLPDFVHGVPGTFRYVGCRACGSVYQSPRVADDDLPRLYPGSYYTHQAQPQNGDSTWRGRLKERIRAEVAGVMREGEGSLAARTLARSEVLRRKALYDLPEEVLPEEGSGPGLALEVGPGHGGDLKRLAELGWATEGLEWDEEAARVAERASGRPVHSGSVLEPPPPGRRYGLVYMSHVLEHLADPLAAFRFVREALAEDGKAVLVFPNLHSLGARRYGPHWYHWDPPRHLVLPSVDGVEEMARWAGLRTRVRTRARMASHVGAFSRRRRGGARGDAAGPGPRDHLFGAAEHLLVAAGRDVGEETVVTLVRRDAP